MVSSKKFSQQTKKVSTLAIKSLVQPQMMLLLFYCNIRRYFHALDLNKEIFSGISFHEVSGFCYKLNRKLL